MGTNTGKYEGFPVPYTLLSEESRFRKRLSLSKARSACCLHNEDTCPFTPEATTRTRFFAALRMTQ